MGTKKILITGSDGYIGAVLTSLLLKKGLKVTGLDTLFYEKNIFGTDGSKYPIIKRDIRNLDGVSFLGFDTVIHLAALSNDPLGELNPKVTAEINFKATSSLAQKAKKEGVKKFIFSSSCSAYGKTDGSVVDEETPIVPLTSYASTKYLAEKSLQELSDDNFFVYIMRNSTVYGPSLKLRTDLVLNNLVASAVTTGEIVVLTDGTPWRALIDVRDLTEIFYELTINDIKELNGVPINIGFSNNNYRIKDLVTAIKKQMPTASVVYKGLMHINKLNYRVNFDRYHSYFPKIKKKYPIEKSVTDLINAMKKNHLSNQEFLEGKFSRKEEITRLQNQLLLNRDLFWTK